jgi:hypothetical protein
LIDPKNPPDVFGLAATLMLLLWPR